MSFYGLNRAAINAGVASFVAGAALLTASSTVEASSTRVVLPTASVAFSSNISATGVRNVFGDGGFVIEANGSAFPALLQLQFSNIQVSSQLRATYTNVWAPLSSAITAEGYITRPGAGTSHTFISVLAAPYVDVGFASKIKSTSSATADASVQRNGFSTVDRDGYARTAFGSGLSANGLRTALPTVEFFTESSAVSNALKTHGGQVAITASLEVSAIASIDMAISLAVSDLTANAVLTQFAESTSVATSDLVGVPTKTTNGYPQLIEAIGDLRATPRFALLGTAFITGLGDSSADGTLIKSGNASGNGTSTSSALGTIIKLGDARFISASSMIGTAYTNIEAPDSANRTMRRQYVDRAMRRPFVDRVLRRQA